MNRESRFPAIGRRGLLIGIGLVGFGIAAALPRRSGIQAASAPGAEAEIAIRDFAFAPSPLEVRVGTTVVWTNRDGEPHTVADVAGGFKSAALDTDDSFRHRFDAPGRFTYVCTLHPHMVGEIVVTA